MQGWTAVYKGVEGGMVVSKRPAGRESGFLNERGEGEGGFGWGVEGITVYLLIGCSRGRLTRRMGGIEPGTKRREMCVCVRTCCVYTCVCEKESLCL